VRLKTGRPGVDLDDHGRRPRFLIHDRDTKFSRAFDAIVDSQGMKTIKTPLRAPNANAHIERWVGSVRRECLERLVIFSRRQLEHVPRVCCRHDNSQRPHRAPELQAPDTKPAKRGQTAAPAALYRRDLLGGLIHEYEVPVGELSDLMEHVRQHVADRPQGEATTSSGST
jgi:putative transposase